MKDWLDWRTGAVVGYVVGGTALFLAAMLYVNTLIN